MFSLDQFLKLPTYIVGWAYQGLVNMGPVPPLAICCVILLIWRPRVPRAVPRLHRRALYTSEWAFHFALAGAILAMIVSSSTILAFSTSGVLNIVRYTSMLTTMTAFSALVPICVYLIMGVLWFSRPPRWRPYQGRFYASKARRLLCYTLGVVPVLTSAVLFVLTLFYDQAVLNMGENSVACAIKILLWDLVLMLALRLGFYSISRRAPVPRVPLALDVSRRRLDVDRLLRLVGVFQGGFAAGCLQIIAQVGFQVGSNVVAASLISLAWFISLTSLLLGLTPAWILAPREDPCYRFMTKPVPRVLTENRTGTIFDVSNPEQELHADHLLRDPDEDLPAADNGSWFIPYDPINTDLGSGSAPEELADAARYLAALAQVAGFPLSEEEGQNLRKLMAFARESSENRARLYTGASSNISTGQPWAPQGVAPLQNRPHEHGNEDQKQRRASRKKGNKEPESAVFDANLQILSQAIAPAMVGFDEETRQAWARYDSEQKKRAQEQALNGPYSTYGGFDNTGAELVSFAGSGDPNANPWVADYYATVYPEYGPDQVGDTYGYGPQGYPYELAYGYGEYDPYKMGYLPYPQAYPGGNYAPFGGPDFGSYGGQGGWEPAWGWQGSYYGQDLAQPDLTAYFDPVNTGIKVGPVWDNVCEVGPHGPASSAGTPPNGQVLALPPGEPAQGPKAQQPSTPKNGTPRQARPGDVGSEAVMPTGRETTGPRPQNATAVPRRRAAAPRPNTAPPPRQAPVGQANGTAQGQTPASKPQNRAPSPSSPPVLPPTNRPAFERRQSPAGGQRDEVMAPGSGRHRAHLEPTNGHRPRPDATWDPRDGKNGAPGQHRAAEHRPQTHAGQLNPIPRGNSGLPKGSWQAKTPPDGVPKRPVITQSKPH